jgi:KDO2-lipid IV(A) lauroyltransferase
VSEGPASVVPLRDRLQYAAFRLARAVLTAIPEVVAMDIGAGLGLLAGSVLRIRRSAVQENLEIAFPGKTAGWRRRVARRCYVHLGREVVFLMRIKPWSSARITERMQVIGMDALMAEAERGRGVVILSAHHGNWELAGAAVAALGCPLDVVGKGMANRLFEADIFETRERLGMRVIAMSDAPRKVLRALGQGRVVAMLSDQNAHRWGVFVPFFGRLAATPRGAALFAIRRSAPVFVALATRDPGRAQRYRLEFRRLEYGVTGDLEVDTRALLTAYHAHLEKAIAAAPEQYFWQHRRWKTRPGEEQAAPGEVRISEHSTLA